MSAFRASESGSSWPASAISPSISLINSDKVINLPPTRITRIAAEIQETPECYVKNWVEDGSKLAGLEALNPAWPAPLGTLKVSVPPTVKWQQLSARAGSARPRC